MTSLSPKVNTFVDLIELRLDVSTLEEIPDLLALQKLRILSFSTSGTERVGRLPESLHEIDAAENKIVNLFRVPSNLKKLNLRSNKIQRIYDDDLPAGLEELSLSNNPAIVLPSRLPERLKVLSASSCSLTSVPTLPVALEFLSISDNMLSELKLGGVSSPLRILHAKNNKLVSVALPPAVPFLERCDLSFNLLSSIPAPILASSALMRLDLSFNRLAGPVQNDLFLLGSSPVRETLKSLSLEASYNQSTGRGSLSEEALLAIDPSGAILSRGLLPVASNIVLASTRLQGNLFVGLLDKIFRSVRNLDLSGNDLHQLPLRATNFQEGAVVDIRGNSHQALKNFMIDSLKPGAPNPDATSTFGASTALTTPIALDDTRSGRALRKLTEFSAMCTVTAETGIGQRFTVILDPDLVGYNEKFCNCSNDFVGRASGQKCQRCDTVVDAIEPRSNITCIGTNGSLVGHGVWAFPSSDGRVRVISCPRTGTSSPCLKSTVHSLPPVTDSSVANITASGLAWMDSVIYTCLDGYVKSRFCSQCALGFFRANRKCSPCEADGDSLRFYISFTVTIISYMLITWVHIREEQLDASGTRVTSKASLVITAPGERLAHIASLAFFIQTVHSINSIFLVPMPKWVYSLLWAPLAATTFTLDGVECIAQDDRAQFLKPFIAGSFQPIVAALCSFSASALRALFFFAARSIRNAAGREVAAGTGGAGAGRGGSLRLKSIFAQGLRAFFFLWLMGIFPSLRSLFSIFSCTTLGSPPVEFGLDRSFVSSFLYVPCNRRHALYNLGHSVAVAGVVFTLVVPPLIIIAAHRRRVDGGTNLGAALSRPYRPGFSGYELINYLRSVGFALAHGIVPMGSDATVISVVVSLTFSISLATWAKPYEARLNNRMSTSGLVICLISFITWQAATSDWSSPEWVGIIIFVVQASFALAELIAIFGFWPKKLGRTMELSSRRSSVISISQLPASG